MKRYESKSDFLQNYIEEFVDRTDANGYITKHDFYVKFSSWCKEQRHREIAENTLGKKMKEKEIEGVKRTFDWLNDGKGGRIYVWEGIKWKE